MSSRMPSSPARPSAIAASSARRLPPSRKRTVVLLGGGGLVLILATLVAFVGVHLVMVALVPRTLVAMIRGR